MTLVSDSPSSSPEVPENPENPESTSKTAAMARTPVTHWSTAAIRAALEAGDLDDWQAIVHALKRDPFGRTARQVEEVVGSAEPYGISTALREVLTNARKELEVTERADVAAEIGTLIETSGLRHAEFASRIGVSDDELTDFLTAAVTPSAALMVRMRRIAQRFGRGRSTKP